MTRILAAATLALLTACGPQVPMTANPDNGPSDAPVWTPDMVPSFDFTPRG